MGRIKRRRNKIWINGHFVDNPKTEGYKKFLEATLPHIEPNIKGINKTDLGKWLESVSNEKGSG